MSTVTVITATWQRHDLLLNRCIPSVAAQTIPVHHIVISDGPDRELADKLWDSDILYVELSKHHGTTASPAINYGDWLAQTDYIAVCDDDNALRPEHCELLSELLDRNPEIDFAYSRIFRHGIGDIIGSVPPRHGQIDGNALMWRRDHLQRYGLWPTEAPHTPDWIVVERWIRNGARWGFVPEVTVDYYFHPGSISWKLEHQA